MGAPADVTWNANTDRQLIESEPPLPRAQFEYKSSAGAWKADGEVFEYVGEFVDMPALHEWLSKLLFLMPGLLNLELADPTVVLETTVEIEDSLYRLQYSQSVAVLGSAISPDVQRVQICAALDLLASPRVAGSSRLQAAVHYFHVASRLLTVAESPWEFMPEAALNMNKALEVLFASERICQNSNQQAREEMERLGLSEDIRETLISVMKLRSHMDVAHVDTWEYPPGSLEGAYHLLARAEYAMRGMLTLLVAKVESGTYELKPDWDSSPSGEALKLLGWLSERYRLPRASH